MRAPACRPLFRVLIRQTGRRARRERSIPPLKGTLYRDEPRQLPTQAESMNTKSQLIAIPRPASRGLRPPQSSTSSSNPRWLPFASPHWSTFTPPLTISSCPPYGYFLSLKVHAASQGSFLVNTFSLTYKGRDGNQAYR